ncbi:hypothetical protein [Chromobacterium phragmitis]|uniref:Uncharacterized protein n=1 Tax=Chromobacterium phragmitis TaxID=2202141 RepID=A0ABV0IQR9_9NEIS
MFLTKEGWRTNNPVVQAIAHPDTAWDAVFFGLTQATFVVRVSQNDTAGGIDANWLLVARPEVLMQLMASAQVEVEDVMVMLPPQESSTGQWICERLMSVVEKTDQRGVFQEYSTEHRTLSTRSIHGVAEVTCSYRWKEHGQWALAQ